MELKKNISLSLDNDLQVFIEGLREQYNMTRTKLISKILNYIKTNPELIDKIFKNYANLKVDKILKTVVKDDEIFNIFDD